MSDDVVVRLGDHLPMTSRRVVYWGRKPASYQTPLGRIEGLADGVVLLRHFSSKFHLEFTPAQAREAAQALSVAAFAVEQWQERARGFNTIRAFRSSSGDVTVAYRGRTRPMRLSKLRGRVDRSGQRHFGRICHECCQPCPCLFVVADDIREHGRSIQHVHLCPPCVDRLVAATRTSVATLVGR